MSPVLDDRGRLFGKVSVVDLFVLLLLVALALFAYARFAGTDTVEGPYELTLTVEKVRDATFAQFEVGDTVTDEGGTVLGHVASFSVTPTRTEVSTDDGRLVEQPSPVFSDVSVVVEGRTDLSSATIRVGSLRLAVGKVLTVRGPGWEVKATIMGVVPVGG